MSVVFAGNFSGRFISTGNAQFIPTPAGIDFMSVRNETTSYAGGAGNGVEFFWDRGDAIGQGTYYSKTVATNALVTQQIAPNAGFFLIDTSITTPGPAIAVTGINAGQPPVVATGNTAGLIPNVSVIQLYSVAGALQFDGMQFTVGTIVANTSFTLLNATAIVAAAGPGFYRVITNQPFYVPTVNYITKIISDPNNPERAIITLSVSSTQWVVGMKVRLLVPTVTGIAFGMTGLDNLLVSIDAVGAPDANGDTNTISVFVNVTGMTPFAFPLTLDAPFQRAQVVPAGENSSLAYFAGTNVLADTTKNIATKGILLMAGVNSPAGTVNAGVGDTITWRLGKSFNL